MHPILIAGAALAGLPILLHLIMKQEPKKLLFPAIRFLKQKQRTNQRKMRLRHLLLLLARMALIALFALTLWQPKLSGSAVPLPEGQPVAAVLVIDTSPSMGYAVNGVTRLAEAVRRANEFIADLPPGSKVAVLDANDSYGVWEPTPGDAKRKLDALKEPSGYAPPLTAVLAAAYQLFATADEDGTEPEDRLPRVVAVFGDRAVGGWDANQIEGLKKARDASNPVPIQLFFDVGTDTAVNVAIAAVEMRPQLIPASADAVLTVTVRADGAAVPSAEVTCKLDDAEPERKEVAIPAGGQRPVTFTSRNLKPGFHTAVIRIRDDNLAVDNVRQFVFAVSERRKILTIADDPKAVKLWELSHNFGTQEFDCAVVATKDVAGFDGYEAVCLIAVNDPSPLWPKVKAYVEAGGKVFIAPPGWSPEIANGSYTTDLMPATLKQEHRDWRTTGKPPEGKENRTAGVRWKVDDDRDLAHAFLAPFRDWRKRGNVDILRSPRRAWRYWDVEKLPGATVVVYFDDADEPAERSPALLEKAIGAGKVLLLTTRLDDPPAAGIDAGWNDYWAFKESTWPTVFPNMVGRYLVGSPEDASFNHTAGDRVTVPLPKSDGAKPRAILFEGPGVADRDSRPTVGANQASLEVTRPTTLTPGVYSVRTEDRKWEQRFALNVPAEESILDKVPEAAVTDLFGPDSVLPVGRTADLKALITTRSGQPRPLFPILLILVLLLFAAEGLFANRFHRAKAG